jgi:hypothetical protein
MNQRWRNHRTLYRPGAEVIRAVEYAVAAIDNDCGAKAFVLAHHAFGTRRPGFASGFITATSLSGSQCSAILAMTWY